MNVTRWVQGEKRSKARREREEDATKEEEGEERASERAKSQRKSKEQNDGNKTHRRRLGAGSRGAALGWHGE